MLTRRALLLGAGAVVTGGAAIALGLARQRDRGGSILDALGGGPSPVEREAASLALPVTPGTVPDGADFGVRGLTPFRIPSQDFYRIDTSDTPPTLLAKDWKLRIHGMVEREVTLTYDDLLARQLTEAWVTLSCVSNDVGGDLIGNAWWSGVRIAPLLAEAGVHPDADAVLQTSVDGWNCGTPIQVLTDDRDAMLAIAMNGRPLPQEHGYPVRMVVPGLYGYVSATKWVTDLEVTRFDRFEAYWTKLGWAPQGPVKTESRIDVPRSSTVKAGRVQVAGVAWAPHTGIEKVEIRLDGQAWAPTELGRVPGIDSWVQWRTTIEVGKGLHHVAVRATDAGGYTQTGVNADVVPDGATGWHLVEFTAE